jgi:hypothetical protein
MALVAIPTAGVAVETTSVQVTCELAEARYLLGIPPADIVTAEADCAARLAELLNTRFAFLDFVAVENRDNKLLVRIGKSKDEVDAGAIRDVNMEISVDGPGVKESGRQVSWLFRSKEEFFYTPAADTFGDAVAVRLGEGLQNNSAQLVEDQLGRLEIANSAWALPDDKSWLLPFSRGELSLADNSTFKIKAKLITPPSIERFTYSVELFGEFASAADVPLEFHNTVKALHLRDDKLEQAESIERLKNAQEVEVMHIVVSRYVKANEPDRATPTTLELE